jgi:hypothetical protein
LLIMLTQNRPGRQTNHNQYARGEREYHSRSALTVFCLKSHEIAIARAAGGQMVQIFLRFRQRHSVLGNRRDHLATGTPNTLGIRKLFPKPATQRS